MKHYEITLYRDITQEVTVKVMADDRGHALDKSRYKVSKMSEDKWKEVTTQQDGHSIKELDMFEDE